MAEDFHVAALKRQRAHLKDVGGDAGKLAENAELLRLAGVDVDELDSATKEKTTETRADSAPVNRRAPERQTAEGVKSDFLAGSKASPPEPNRADKPESGSEPNAADKPGADKAPNMPNPKKPKT